MPVPVIDLPLASPTWGEEEVAAAHAVIDSGYTTMGPHVKAFEQAFADYVGSKFCVMSNSGSSANLLAVAALFFTKENALKPGDEVIVPTVSWSTTYYPLAQYGLVLKFVDVDPETLNLDLKGVEEAVSDKTKLIMVVHLLGNPVDMAALKKLAPQARIVEDTCESMGATLNGKHAGTFGELGTFSSFFSHHICTMEGGMTVTDDEELYHILLSIRSHGWTRHLPEENQVCKLDEDPFYNLFSFVLPGYNLRPLEIEGAIGVHQIKKLPALVETRRQNGAAFVKAAQEKLTPLGVTLQKEVGESSWFCFAMTFPTKAIRSAVIKVLNEAKVGCRPVAGGNFLKHAVMQHIQHELVGTDDVAERVRERALFIGNHGRDYADKLVQVVDLVADTVKAAQQETKSD